MNQNFRETFLTLLRHILFLCQKELLVSFKDRRMQVMMVMPVLIQGFLFGYAANFNLEEAPYAVVDESRSAASRELLAGLDGGDLFIRVKTLDNSAQIADEIDSGRVILAIVIPQDFQDKLSRGEQAPVQIITDGRNNSIAGAVTSYVSSVITDFNEKNGVRSPVTVVSRTWYNPNQITRWNFLPSLIAMIAFVQVVLLAGLSIAKEREDGTFDQLLVTPLTPGEILIGKAMPSILVGLFQTFMLYLIARYWFSVPFSGSFFVLFFLIFLFILASTGIGLSVSAIARNMQQVLVYVLVLVLPMALLSGIATPIRNMPDFLQILTYADPMRFAVDAVKRIYLEGCSLYDVRMDILPLFIITCITLPIAGMLFRKRT
jgi:ABC-2 type transport system permease protein